MAKAGRPKKIKYSCMDCTDETGKLLEESNFYTVKGHHTHKDRGYKIKICRSCLRQRVYKTSKREEVNLQQLQLTLRELNLPFIYNYYVSAANRDSDTVGSYFSYLNLGQLQGATWADSVFDDKDEENNKRLMQKLATKAELEAIFDEENRIEVIPGIFRYKDTLKHKYGEGFDMEVLLRFERKYLELYKQVQLETAMDREHFIMFIMTAIRYRDKQSEGATGRELDAIGRDLDRISKNVKFIDNDNRSKLLSTLMKKVEEHNGNFDFVKYGFLDEPLDKIDKAIYLTDRLNRRNQGLDNSEYQYRDLYKTIREQSTQSKDDLDSKSDNIEDITRFG